MIDLTKITPEQAKNIEIALAEMEEAFNKKINAYTSLANNENISDKIRITSKCNAEWWKSVHALIYGEKEI